MASCKLQFHSEILKRATEVNILLPQNTALAPDVCHPPFPVLYLLHGLGDNHNAWLRNSSVERHVETHNLCVVMPGTDRGFYTDTTYGMRHYTYITEELPQLISRYFPVSQKREDNFVCGLSMGGYGALKLGLRHPERYAAVAAFSSAPVSLLMMRERLERAGTAEESELDREMRTVFGTGIKPEDDLFVLAQDAATAPQKPAIFLCCGEDDALFPLNVALKKKLEAHDYNLTWQSHPGVAHEWSYWDKMLPEALRWFREKR